MKMHNISCTLPAVEAEVALNNFSGSAALVRMDNMSIDTIEMKTTIN